MSTPATTAQAPVGTDHRAVPAQARQLAARLSALFDRDVEIVKRLNDAHQRLQQANERLSSGLAPDACGFTLDDDNTAAIGQSPIAALIRDGEPTATSQVIEALKQAHWQIHRAFCQYQSTSEERRQLAFDVGELSQQLTHALCTAGWNADQAQNANVHQLALTTT